jgi:hypothetical protein
LRLTGQAGDAVIELDRLCAALLCIPPDQHPSEYCSERARQEFLPFVLAVRDAAIAALAGRGFPNTAWVVASRAEAQHGLQGALPGAEVVRIEATLDECLERQTGDPRRSGHGGHESIIVPWFRGVPRGCSWTVGGQAGAGA